MSSTKKQQAIRHFFGLSECFLNLSNSQHRLIEEFIEDECSGSILNSALHWKVPKFYFVSKALEINTNDVTDSNNQLDIDTPQIPNSNFNEDYGFEDTRFASDIIFNDSYNHTLIELDDVVDKYGFDFSRVIFLDWDGIDHPRCCLYRDRFYFLANYCGAIRSADPNKKVPIVISSELRNARSLEEIRNFHTEDIAAQIIGVTPSLSPSNTTQLRHYAKSGAPAHLPCIRQLEIEMWMKVHAPKGQWLAIDGNASRFNTDCENIFAIPKSVRERDEEATIVHVLELAKRLRTFLA